MITLTDWAENPIESMIEIAAGNMGAGRVASELYAHQTDTARGVLALMNADDMGIRGTQLWVAYKYHCNQDLHALCERLVGRDEILKRPPPHDEED